jgi:hypothetical protein
MKIIEEMHKRIKDAIADDHPGVYVDVYPELQKTLQIPAVLIELAELRQDDDQGTEQLPLIAFFEARCIVAPEDNGMMNVRKLAASVAYSIYRSRRFCLPIMPAVIINVAYDVMKPELDEYDVWVVEWTHNILVGEDLWKADVLPREIILGKPPAHTVQPMPPGELIPEKVFVEKQNDVYERLYIDGIKNDS